MNRHYHYDPIARHMRMMTPQEVIEADEYAQRNMIIQNRRRPLAKRPAPRKPANKRLAGVVYLAGIKNGRNP